MHFTCYTYFSTILYFWLFLFTHQHHIQIMMPKISNLQCIFTEIINDWPYTHISLNFYFDFSVIIQRYPSLYNINILGSYKIYIYAYKTYETSHVLTDRKDHHFYIILKKKHLSLVIDHKPS